MTSLSSCFLNHLLLNLITTCEHLWLTHICTSFRSITFSMTTSGNFTSMSVTPNMPTSLIPDFLISSNHQVHFFWSAIPWGCLYLKSLHLQVLKLQISPPWPCLSSLQFLYSFALLYIFFIPSITSSPSVSDSTLHVPLFQSRLPLCLVLVSYSAHCHNTHLNGHIIYSYWFSIS